MDGRPRISARRVFLVLLVVMASLVGVPLATAAEGPDQKLGWSACAWPADHVVTVGLDPEHPFPGAGFADRLDDAIRRWDEMLQATPLVLGMTRSEKDPDVTVSYQAPEETAGNSDVLGETSLAREGDPTTGSDLDRCPDRVGPYFTLVEAVIRIAPRSDWFTGPDEAVASWQNCAGMLMQVLFSGTCAARVDVGSTMIHELGHALGLYHPEALDTIDGVPPEDSGSASMAARCVEVTGAPEDQATMCESQAQWRADQRTLAQWDADTLARQYHDQVTK